VQGGLRQTALPRRSQPRRDREIVVGKDLAKYLAGVLGYPMTQVGIAKFVAGTGGAPKQVSEI